MGETRQRYCPGCDRWFPHDTARCPIDGAALFLQGAVPAPAAADPLLGKSLAGRFEIVERIGGGVTGTVYRARRHSVPGDVAIKVLRADLDDDNLAARRFLRETRLAGHLAHPNIVTMLDSGESDGRLFLVMELVTGPTLGAVLSRDGRFPLARVVRVGSQICGALAAAHALSIVHRDLKPENVLLVDDPADTVKVLDFGLAKSLAPRIDQSILTEEGTIAGTPSYMAPEVARGIATDARSDLYSLGVILYELATGQLPFRASTLEALLARQLYDPPPPMTGVPPLLENAILRLLAKNPDERPRSAEQARATLEAVLQATPRDPR